MERLLRYFHLFICLIWLLIVDQNAIWAERPQSLNFISKSQFTMWPKKPPGAQEPFLNRWPTPNKIPPTIIQTAASLSSAASSWVASCVASNSCSFPKKQRFLFEAKIHKAKHCDIKWHGLPRRMDISGDFDIFSQSCWKSACFASCACGTASSASASPHRVTTHQLCWLDETACVWMNFCLVSNRRFGKSGRKLKSQKVRKWKSSQHQCVMVCADAGAHMQLNAMEKVEYKAT